MIDLIFECHFLVWQYHQWNCERLSFECNWFGFLCIRSQLVAISIWCNIYFLLKLFTIINWIYRQQQLRIVGKKDRLLLFQNNMEDQQWINVAGLCCSSSVAILEFQYLKIQNEILFKGVDRIQLFYFFNIRIKGDRED